MWVDYWGAKGYVGPPSQIIGGPAPPPPPPPSSYAYVFRKQVLRIGTNRIYQEKKSMTLFLQIAGNPARFIVPGVKNSMDEYAATAVRK